MVTEVIKDKKLLDVLQNAIEFEQTKGKQKTCFYCGEEFQIQKNFETLKDEGIPDEWTCSKGHKITSIGWEWHDVANSYHLVQRLLRMGLAKIKRKSNKHTEYCLLDRNHTMDIIRATTRPKDAVPAKQYAQMFSDIVGHEEIKKIISRAILSPRPVHLLLVGPTASAKTMFQLELESIMPDAYFVDGANMSGPGLVDLLFENDIRYLIIDEMEEMGREDLGVLASFMQTGRLSETKYLRTRTREMNVSVIGSCNNTSKMSPKLLSRFLCIYFQEYTYEEFVQICGTILGRQGTTPGLAEKIARIVWHDVKSRDIRDALKISSIVKDEDDLKWISDMVQKGILVPNQRT